MVPLITVTASLAVALLCDTASAIPLSHNILHNQKECLYEKLDRDEHLTFSVFIGSGRELRATATLDGPVGKVYDESRISATGANVGAKVVDDVNQYDRGRRFAREIANEAGIPQPASRDVVHEIKFVEKLDFEQYAEDMEGDEFDDYYYADDDEERLYHEYVGDDDEISETERKRREEMFKKQRDRFRQEREKKRAGEREAKAAGTVRRDGEPWQKTIRAQVPGWYRACVSASWYQITAEMELRKSSELGPPDESTGHVITYERRALLDADKLHVQNAASETDLKETNEQIRKLEQLLHQIRRKQEIERHELSLHSAVNERSHSRMVLSSLLETILFIGVTLFQIYSIKQWFDSSPVLVR